MHAVHYGTQSVWYLPVDLPMEPSWRRHIAVEKDAEENGA